VIGEYERAFYGAQYASMAPPFEHYGIQLWTPKSAGGSTATPRITSRPCWRWGCSPSGRSPGSGSGSGPRWRPRPASRAVTGPAEEPVRARGPDPAQAGRPGHLARGRQPFPAGRRTGRRPGHGACSGRGPDRPAAGCRCHAHLRPGHPGPADRHQQFPSRHRRLGPASNHRHQETREGGEPAGTAPAAAGGRARVTIRRARKRRVMGY
jgi:hypothetical protein